MAMYLLKTYNHFFKCYKLNSKKVKVLMSLFICGNDSWYFYFYRFDASSPMVSSSLSPLPSGGKLDPPVRITLSNQVLRSYQVVNRLVPIVDGLTVGKCRVISTIGEQESFPDTFSSVTRFLKLYRSYLLQDGKSKLILPSPPPNNVVSRHLQQQTSQHRSGGGGGGVSGMVYIVCIS